jgi:hypothetical protein
MDEVLVPQAVEEEGAVAVADPPAEACAAEAETCAATEAVAEAEADVAPAEDPAPT